MIVNLIMKIKNHFKQILFNLSYKSLKKKNSNSKKIVIIITKETLISINNKQIKIEKNSKCKSFFTESLSIKLITFVLKIIKLVKP